MNVAQQQGWTIPVLSFLNLAGSTSYGAQRCLKKEYAWEEEKNDRKNKEDSFGRAKHGVCFPVCAYMCVCVCVHARVCAGPDSHIPQDGKSPRNILSDLLPNTSFIFAIFLRAKKARFYLNTTSCRKLTISQGKPLNIQTSLMVKLFSMSLNEDLQLFLQ